MKFEIETWPPAHPGELLKMHMMKSKITQASVAANTGLSLGFINDLIHGKRGLSPKTALTLSKYTGHAPEDWVKWQNDWDLKVALDQLNILKGAA